LGGFPERFIALAFDIATMGKLSLKVKKFLHFD